MKVYYDKNNDELLTEEEMNRELENKPEDWLKRLCIRLANVLKEIGEEYNIER